MSTLELLKIFTEPQRLRILHLLKSAALNVNELVEILNVSQSNISHHIKILKNLGLVELRKSGNQNYYTAGAPKLPDSLINIWGDTAALVAEMPEAVNDERNLTVVLRARDTNDESVFRDWRKKQPDLPFTHEFALAGLPSADTAIDIGCGAGELLEIISRSFTSVIGIDNAVKQLVMAKKQLTGKNTKNNVRLINAAAEYLPLANASADTAYYRMSFGFIQNPLKALKETLRILKSGGRISIIDRTLSEDNRDNGFTKTFFQDFCKKNQASLLDYRLHQQVFICCIEKN